MDEDTTLPRNIYEEDVYAPDNPSQAFPNGNESIENLGRDLLAKDDKYQDERADNTIKYPDDISVNDSFVLDEERRHAALGIAAQYTEHNNAVGILLSNAIAIENYLKGETPQNIFGAEAGGPLDQGGPI